MYIFYLFSFIGVTFFSLFLWSDVNKKQTFGKRPLYLLISLLILALIGVFILATSIVGYYTKPLPKPAAETLQQSPLKQDFLDILATGVDSLFVFPAFTIISIAYLLCFFLLEYSIHCQRIEKSFLTNDFRMKLKSFYWLLFPLVSISIASCIIYALKEPLALLEEIRERGLFQRGIPLGILYFNFLMGFSLFYFLITVNINNNIFNLQRGVIRKQTILFNTLFGVIFLCTIYFVFFNGFGLEKDFRIFGLVPSSHLPIEIFTILNVVYVIRLYTEYFYQRLLNLDKTIEKYIETVELKNDLINLVLASPVSEDINIIKSAVAESIERSMRNLVVNEYRITGTYVLRRTENWLKVDSSELIYEYCTPLIKTPGLNLKKQTKAQLNDLILRKSYDIDRIMKSKKEDLNDWGEQVIKNVFDTNKEYIIDPLPKEFLGLQRFIGLYPIINMGRVDGIVIVFKDSFEFLFPEEQNAIKDMIDDLKVIFAIIEGKRVQSEKNRLQGEMDTARRIQTSILPKTVDIPGYDTACFMETTTEVGGDAYDFFATENGNYLGIGDVSGHGLPAGITALIQQAAFQSSIFTSLAIGIPAKPYMIYNIVNNVLCRLNSERIGSDKFMTQNYFLEKDGHFIHAGAHEIALLYFNKEEKMIELKDCAKKTAYMGLTSSIDAKDSEGSFDMAEGDILVIYSDGIIEAKDHFYNQYGIANLKHLILTHSEHSAAEIVKKIVSVVKEHAKEGDMKKYAGKLADDISLIVLKKLK
ncbi:MAG: SpoIIE family protein phosphatase [Spirochaetales bacterium]|nr:SpoIIE family protein phosphatase [Spirochaetales bacterium]